MFLETVVLNFLFLLCFSVDHSTFPLTIDWYLFSVTIIINVMSQLLVLVLFIGFYSNKKIIGVCNWSSANERSAPSREVPMTKELITSLRENQGR